MTLLGELEADGDSYRLESFLQLPIVLNQKLVVMVKFDMRQMLETVVK